MLEPDVELIYSKDESFKEVEDSMIIKVKKDNDGFKLFIQTLNIKKETELDEKIDFKVLFDYIVSIVDKD